MTRYQMIRYDFIKLYLFTLLLLEECVTEKLMYIGVICL